MYKILIANSKVEKRLQEYINFRSDIRGKLDRLKLDPRRELDAHPLHGKLFGKWSCWLGSNIRIIYVINDVGQSITIEAVGTHKEYNY